MSSSLTQTVEVSRGNIEDSITSMLYSLGGPKEEITSLAFNWTPGGKREDIIKVAYTINKEVDAGPTTVQ